MTFKTFGDVLKCMAAHNRSHSHMHRIKYIYIYIHMDVSSLLLKHFLLDKTLLQEIQLCDLPEPLTHLCLRRR